MTGSVILDTNIVIALFAEDVAVLERMAGAERVFVPAVVLGELYYGARKSTRSATNVQRVHDFADGAQVLDTDAGTADEYGRVRLALQRKGNPIPENDVWLAALALQHGMVLVTRGAHFAYVDNLIVASW